MTPRQFEFVREYLQDNNATRAMVRAGYSARTANKHAWRLISHPQVRKLIDAALADRDCKVKVEATGMLESMASEARSELLTAREDLQAATRRLRFAVNTVRDIERLCAPVNSRPPAPERSPEPKPVALAAPEWRPISPQPAPMRFSGTMDPAYHPFSQD